MKDRNDIKLVNIGILPKPEIKTIKCGEAEIEVATIIPYEDVFDMIQWCISYIADDRPFISEPIRHLIMDFALLKYYTNLDISFINEEARIVDIYSDYDIIKQSGLVNKVIDIIDKSQYKFFIDSVNKTIQSITEYKNSAVGIVDNLAQNANQDVDTMQRMMDAVQDTEEMNAVGNLIKFAQKIRPQEETNQN